jgi:hypothetical protein
VFSGEGILAVTKAMPDLRVSAKGGARFARVASARQAAYTRRLSQVSSVAPRDTTQNIRLVPATPAWFRIQPVSQSKLRVSIIV